MNMGKNVRTCRDILGTSGLSMRRLLHLFPEMELTFQDVSRRFLSMFYRIYFAETLVPQMRHVHQPRRARFVAVR